MGPKWGPNGVQNDTYLKIASRIAQNRLRAPSGTPPERKNTIFMSQKSILNGSYIVLDPPDKVISPLFGGVLKNLLPVTPSRGRYSPYKLLDVLKTAFRNFIFCCGSSVATTSALGRDATGQDRFGETARARPDLDDGAGDTTGSLSAA